MNFASEFSNSAPKTAFTKSAMEAPLILLDKAITYAKNLIVHSDSAITWASGTLTWAGTIRILFNTAAGLAVQNTIAASNIALSDNEFCYVDLNETNDTALTMQKAAVTTASASNFLTVARLVMAYRNTANDELYTVWLPEPTLPVARGGTGVATFTDHGVLIGSGTGAITPLTPLAAGELLIGVGSADPHALAAGATTKILVGGGAADPVWTEATGSGAPVRETSPTLVTPLLGTPTSGDLQNCTGATETTKGVVELDTVAEVIAGADTSRATTAQGVVAADAIIRRADDQCIYLTAAASGSNGIQNVDDANLDYGTGNFSGAIDILLSDYTPAAEVVLCPKTDGTNGREFTLQTNGKLRVTINTTDYDSTVANTCTDNTRHMFGYSVTRETASVAGSIYFIIDGIQLGDAVAITAGAPTTVDNAVSQYWMGTSTTRTGGRFYNGYSFNRALTVAGHLFLYRYGLPYSDRHGCQTSKYTGDFSTGSDGWTGTETTVAGNIDSIGGEDDWLRAYASSNSAAHRVLKALTSLEIYKFYQITIKYFIPVNTNVNGFKLMSSGGGVIYNLDGTTHTTIQNVVGTTTTVTVEVYGFSATTGPAYWMTTNGSTTFAGAGVDTDDLVYIKEVEIKEIGATSALESEGFQPIPGQCLDSSTNKLHAMQPAAGTSLMRRKKDFEVRWTNTWAGTHEAQYIGGVNQAVLPANCYIDDIIGVITGGTIEDIIIGDGSDTDRWVEITTGLAAGTTSFTLANRISDGTNYKLVVDPDANFTGSIVWTLRGHILD